MRSEVASLRNLGLLVCFLPLATCLGVSNGANLTANECAYGSGSTDPVAVPQCVRLRGRITVSDAERAKDLLIGAQRLADSLDGSQSTYDSNQAAEIARALSQIIVFYSRGLFDDSARFHRMLDHVAVTEHYVRGDSILWLNGLEYPASTPHLAWQYYPDAGVYFQPVATVNPQFLVSLLPRPDIELDSLLQLTDQLYNYAIWRERAGRAFPVWEYEFRFSSGGIPNDPPWISSLSQGLAMMVFLERFRRTGDPLWKRRALEVFGSYYVTWNDGGILLPDTTHGYWWEEFSPTVRIWNGSAWSVLAIGYLWQLTGDPEVARMFGRGIDAIKYYTPEYDTGSWTLYSKVQGYNTVLYHRICITIMDQLFAQSGDSWFKTVADKWRSYVPPAGVH